MSAPGTLGTREDSVVSAPGTLGCREDSAISASGTLGNHEVSHAISDYRTLGTREASVVSALLDNWYSRVNDCDPMTDIGTLTTLAVPKCSASARS